MPRQAHTRQLLQGSRDVSTAEELATAIRDSVEDIRIIEHIDLSTVEVDNDSDQAKGSRTLPDVLSPTTSIRGDCLTAPSNQTVQQWNVTTTPALLQRTERQCLIVCDTDCLTIKANALWMDSIYWRFKRTERSDSSSNESVDTQVPQVLTVLGLGQLYMSNVTIQGDGQIGRRDATQALFLPDVSSHVFAEDLVVDSVGGKQTSGLDIYGSASFLKSTFQNIRINNGKEYAIIFVRQRANLMLREAKLSGNAARFDVGKNKNGNVYLQPEQKEDIKVKALDVTFSDNLDYDDLTIDVAEAPVETFKSENDDFYRRERGQHLDFVKPLSEGGVNLSTAAVVGIALACVVALVAIAAIVAAFIMRRTRQNRRGMESIGSSEYSKGGGASPGQGNLRPPSSDSSIKQRLAWVHWQLDQFDDQNLILKRYQSLGPAARRQGGQAVVQFARNVLDQREYALKIFAIPHAYQAEAAMYQDECMANFLPRVEGMHDGTDDDFVDPCGHKLPPIIIMEKGESLNEWSARAEPDLFMSIAVLANVALRMAEFHAAGYVHRDLKPANVMWLPRENRWTVIDFGCAGKIGATVPLSFTLVYAAPEVIGALQDGDKTITADPALDTWALGVMAFELLSGKPAFHVLSDGKSEVIKQLTGEKRLPWEEQGPMAAERLESLGVFKGAVLQLLNRDPTLRPSMQRFYDAANRIFSSRTTIKI